MESNNHRHVVELDSIRGIAAVAVMVGHCLTYYETPQWFHTAALLFNGRAAVSLFFVLSGYVLARSLDSMTLQARALGRYYIRRIFRLYPAIWAASLLSLLYLMELHPYVSVPGLGESAARQYRAERFDALHLAASFAGMLAYLLPQLWSIVVEIVASAAMPFISYVLYRKTALFPALLALSVGVSFTIGPRTYYNIGLYQVDFLVGAAICWTNTHLPSRVASVLKCPATLISFGILACLTQFLPGSYYDPTAHITESIICWVIVSSAVLSQGETRLLASRAMIFLGSISYSVYLLHFTVLCAIVRLQAIVSSQVGIESGTIPLSLSAAVLTIVFTLPLSWLSYRYVELGGMRLGRLMVDWLGFNPAPGRNSANAASNHGIEPVSQRIEYLTEPVA